MQISYVLLSQRIFELKLFGHLILIAPHSHNPTFLYIEKMIIDNFFLKNIGMSDMGSITVIDINKFLWIAFIGVCFGLSMVISNEVLANGSYPALIVGNAAKPLFVFIVRSIFVVQRCTKERIQSSLLIFYGLFICTFVNGNINGPYSGTKLNMDVVSFITLILDAIVEYSKEYVIAEFEVDRYGLMTIVNLIAAVVALAFAIWCDQISTFVLFASDHPEIILYMLLLSIFGLASQALFIYFILIEKQFMCVTIKMGRKILSIVCSILLFENDFSIHMFFGAFLIFSGAILDACWALN